MNFEMGECDLYNYPNPCEICQTANCTNKGCNEWRMRFLTIWKQFNSYVQRQYRRGNKTEKFGYEHPDLLRKYLREGPCKGCKIEESCDTPCGAYYNWWDARMAWLKFRFKEDFIRSEQCRYTGVR